MKVCPKCSTQYPDDANFCPTDAGRLVAAPESASAAAPSASSLAGIHIEPPGVEELYELGARLGGGSTGQIFQATERSSGEVCAVKRVRPALFLPASAGMLQRTERELKQLERVDSPGIARALAHGRDGDSLWIACELVSECRSARDLVEDDGPMEVTRASRIVLAIGQALSDAARLGVIHRDLAPKNVLVLPDDRVKIVNFSIPVLTTRKVHGVAEFVSPEQVEGRPADQRSSIYSLGAVFYYLVSGRPPYVGEASELYVLHATGTPEPPSVHVPVPEAVDGVILRALERSASKRYMTMRQFLGVIESLASGDFEAAVAPTSPAGRRRAKNKLTDTLLGGYGMVDRVHEAHAQSGGQGTGAPAPVAPAVPPAQAAVVAEAAPAAVVAPVPEAAALAGSADSASRATHEQESLSRGAAQALAGEAAAAARAAAGAPVAAEAAGAASEPSAAAPGRSASQPDAATAESRAGRPPSTGVIASTPDGTGHVAAAARGADSGPASAPELPRSKVTLRETPWFQRGERDAAAAGETSRGRPVAGTEDVAPVGDHHADDGSLAVGDRQKLSGKAGGAVPRTVIRQGSGTSSTVSDRELVSELTAGRGKIIAAIVVGMVLVGALVAYAISTSGHRGSGKTPPAKPAIEQGGAPAAPASPPQ